MANFMVDGNTVQLWYNVDGNWCFDGYTYWDFDNDADAESFAKRMNSAVATSLLKAVA